MSEEEAAREKIDHRIIPPPTDEKEFLEEGNLIFCRPHLMPLKSVTLEKLERMQKLAKIQLQENRVKTAKHTKI